MKSFMKSILWQGLLWGSVSDLLSGATSFDY